MASEFVIYSIGSPEFLRSVLNGLAMITGSGDFEKTIMIGLLLGILLICVQTIIKGGQGGIAWQYPLMGWIFYATMFVPTATVIIEDVYDGTDYVVDNVPLGAAVSGSVISKIGYGLTELMGQGYDFPGNSNPANAPYLESLYLLQAARTGAISTDIYSILNKGTNYDTAKTLSVYIDRCVTPKLRKENDQSYDTNSKKNINDLLMSEDTNYHTTVFKKNGVREGKSCRDAYTTDITTILNRTRQDDVKQYICTVARGKSVQPGQILNCEDPNRAIENLTNNLRETQNWIALNVVAPIFTQSLSKYYGDWGQQAAAIMINQAIQQRNTQWAAEHSMFLNTARPMMSFFEGFFYAITPFVGFLMCFGVFGYSVLKMYFQTLIWINLWMPILAICNLYIITSAGAAIAGKLASLEPGTSMESIYALNSVNGVVQTWIATGGMLAAATPVIAYMLVSGSAFAFTSLANRLGGRDHINEKLVSPDVATNGPLLQNAPMYNATMAQGVMYSGAVENAPKVNVGQIAQKGAQSAKSNMEAKSEEFGKALSQDQNFTKTVASDMEAARSIASNMAQRLVKAGKLSESESEDFANRAAYSLHASAHASAKTGVKLPGGIFEADIGGDFGLRLNKDGSFTSSKGVITAKELQDSYETGVSQSISSNERLSSGKRFSDGVSSATQEANRQLVAASKQYSETESFSRNIGLNQTTDAGALGEQLKKIADTEEYGKMTSAIANDVDLRDKYVKSLNSLQKDFGMQRDNASAAAAFLTLAGSNNGMHQIIATQALAKANPFAGQTMPHDVNAERYKSDSNEPRSVKDEVHTTMQGAKDTLGEAQENANFIESKVEGVKAELQTNDPQSQSNANQVDIQAKGEALKEAKGNASAERKYQRKAAKGSFGDVVGSTVGLVVESVKTLPGELGKTAKNIFEAVQGGGMPAQTQSSAPTPSPTSNGAPQGGNLGGNPGFNNANSAFDKEPPQKPKPKPARKQGKKASGGASSKPQPSPSPAPAQKEPTPVNSNQNQTPNQQSSTTDEQPKEQNKPSVPPSQNLNQTPNQQTEPNNDQPNNQETQKDGNQQRNQEMLERESQARAKLELILGMNEGGRDA